MIPDGVQVQPGRVKEWETDSAGTGTRCPGDGSFTRHWPSYCPGPGRAGVHIAINYVNRADAAAEVQAAVQSLGREALVVQADVAVADDVARMVTQVLDHFGRVDILVNNATLHRGRLIHKLPAADWEAVLNSCLTGAYHCCRQLVPHMMARQSGRIINISSAVGLIGWPGDTAYGAAKAGLIGFTRSLAKEVAPYGITANVVMPGYIRTDMTAALTAKISPTCCH